MFTIYNEADPGSTLVSNLFIDEYMRDANDAQIKVYLYLLRMMSARRATCISDIADHFNHTERDVLRSLHYWEKQGLVVLEYSREHDLVGIRLSRLQNGYQQQDAVPAPVYPAQTAAVHASDYPAQAAAIPASDYPAQTAAIPASGYPAQTAAIPASGYPAQTAAAATGRVISMNPASGLSFDPDQASQEDALRDESAAASPVPEKSEPAVSVLEAFRNNKNREQLLFVIEQYLGKPLSPAEIQSVYYISEDLHFSDDLIDYLMQYCIDRGKKDFRYIEKVAVNWARQGIKTTRQAEHAVSPLGRNTKAAEMRRAASNKFNQFAQNRYDFEQLEQQILGG